MDWSTAQQLALALGLGLLVGFQREWTSPHVAGIRTFSLITVLGALTGLFREELGAWVVVIGFAGVCALILAGGLMRFGSSPEHAGLTTQVSALVMYLVGVAVALGHAELGVVVGGGVAVLLQWKRPLHAFVERIGEKDIHAIIQLALIALVILPVLPNQHYGPYQVLNPFEIWMMVVLICGISLGAYIAYKFVGPQAGTLLAGVLGGLISSTATTVSYSRRARHAPDSTRLSSLVIMIASTIVFGRVIAEIAIVAPELLREVAAPLLAMMVWMSCLSSFAYLRLGRNHEAFAGEQEPSDLKSALLFGALYGVVLFAVAAAQHHFGDQALFAVAALSGLTDMDAITLSTAQMIKAQNLEVDTGWRMILIGGLSNMFFKTCAVAALGSWSLLWRMVVLFGLASGGGVLILTLWP